MIWLVVGIGGGLGAMARHGVNSLVHRWLLGAEFPHGIFLINVVGSGAIGLIAGLVASSRVEISLEARTFLVVGVLGGFTTFSSFSLDTLTLVRGGQVGLAMLNVGGQVILSLVAVALGYRVGSWM
jgi:fluoride exporter